MQIRVPILPVSVSEGIITFNTVILSFPVGLDGVKKHWIDPKYDDTVIYSVTPSDPVNIYIDPSKEPKFSRCADGRGWCSPTEEKQEQLVAAGLDIDECTIIRCKCQQGNMTREDIVSLEQCGHALECPKAAPIVPVSKPTIVYAPRSEVPSEPTALALNIDPEILAAVNHEAAKPKKDFCPPNGVPESIVKGPLIAYMEGTSSNEMSVSTALSGIGYDKPYDESVVLKELARFSQFTICNGCHNWSTVMNLANPRCLGCQSMPSLSMEE